MAERPGRRSGGRVARRTAGETDRGASLPYLTPVGTPDQLMSTRALDLAHLDAAEVAAVRRVLEAPEYELIPLKGALAQSDYLPEGATVSVTASPNNGMTPTVNLTLELKDRGFEVTPHISARMISNRAELESILIRLSDANIQRALVVGGDNQEPGEFFDGLSLLTAMEEMGHGLTEIGIPGYPEGHHIVDRPTIDKALEEKAPFASYVTSQMCFSPDTVVDWINGLRETRLGLGVYIGIPGVVELRKLISISARIGVGVSRRFISHNKSLAGKLVRPGGYCPDHLILGLAPLLAEPRANIHGFHIYTFNQVETTEQWRRDRLEELA